MKLLLATLVAMLGLAPAAQAAPPSNDSPATPVPFQPYSTQMGLADDKVGSAELFEATADPGVPKCLGSSSFARTVWFRVDPAPTMREITIEASGRTLDVPDLAAFVTNGGAVNTIRPNICNGAGTGGATSAEDRLSSLTVHVPAGLAMLVQVGRRDRPTTPEDERAVVWMSESPFTKKVPPLGDRVDSRTPRIPRRTGRLTADLWGATTTFDDPATPECTSAGGVWRRYKVPRKGRYTFRVRGFHAGALSVFKGRPRQTGLLGCVDREGTGPLVLPLRSRSRKNQWLWARLGTDRAPAGARATIEVRPRARRDRLSGGSCLGAARPLVRGSLVGAPIVKVRNRTRRLSVLVRTSKGPVCRARLTLVGPRKRTYAKASVFNLQGSGQVISLRRVRRLVRGRYVLRMNGVGLAGVRTAIRTRVSFRLRPR
jgi:hypothetical protein